jgi:hypothetical protein
MMMNGHDTLAFTLVLHLYTIFSASDTPVGTNIWRLETFLGSLEGRWRTRYGVLERLTPCQVLAARFTCLQFTAGPASRKLFVSGNTRAALLSRIPRYLSSFASLRPSRLPRWCCDDCLGGP